MSAHRRAPRTRSALRRTFTAAILAIVAGTGYLAAAGPAQAAGPWYVANGGSNANPCTAAAAPCATVTGVLAKAGFVSGDTINVAQGTYTDHPTFAAKTANIIGGGSGATFSGFNSFFAIGVNIGNANVLTLNNVILTQGRNLTNNLGGGLVIATGKVVATNVTLNANGGGTITQGGGAYVGTGASLSMFGGAVTGNGVTTQGGGIYSVGTVLLDGTSVTGNTSGNQGGAVVATGGLTTNNALINNNAAAQLGGAIVSTGTTNITGGSLSGNTSLNGGAAYVGGTTVVDGTTIGNNTANGAAIANGGNGGAFYNAANLTLKNATLTANKAVLSTNASPGISGWGGGIFSVSLAAAGAPKVTVQNSTIDGGGLASNANAGGAIAALGNVGLGGANTVLDATNLIASNNVAAAAGGIYTVGPTTLTRSALTHNKATHASAGLGGGLYAAVSGAAPTVTLDDTLVNTNDAAAGGGGMVLGAGVNVELKNNTRVLANTSTIGAGIFSAAALTVRNSSVNGNTASNSGGGIYTASNVALINSTVNSNSAAFLGGGLSTTATAGGFSATSSHLEGNNAFGGGGVFVGNGLTASFTGTDFVANTSTGANFGGGAILSAGRVSIDKATLSGNKADGASGSGGAIFSGSADDNITTSLSVSNSTLTGNQSYVGSAIYAGSSKATSTNKTSISNSTIHANAASGPFGAIEVLDPTSITGSTITDNTAVPTSPFDAYGGIVAQAANLVSLSGSILAGNNGHQCNAAVADGGYNLNDPTASECGLSAGRNDVFAPAQLGSLAGNGGPTQTRLPGPASPALDRIPAGTATGVTDAITGAAITLCGAGATDQRGTARPQGAKCDIGAVEADQVAPTIAGPASADYSVGSPGTPLTYTTTGSPRPTLSSTALPSGVTFTDNGDGTGTIAGTPASNTGGTYSITVTAHNEKGDDTVVLTLVVHQAPTISGPSADTYTVGQPGGPTAFTQSSGHPLGTFSSTGTLPGGVTFDAPNPGSGSYAGTPAAGTGGVYHLTVKDSNGTPPDATKDWTLTVNEAPGIDGPSSATFKVGEAGASGEFTASGFPVPTFSATGLPSGLDITGSGTAKITGTPANGTGGVYPVVVKADNGVGTAATKDVSVTVNEAPELTGPTAARFVTGSANAIGFSSDGYPQAALSISGSLPTGLSFLDNGNGSATISGTAAVGSEGSYSVTVTASNGVSPDAHVTVTIEVVPPLSITTTTLPDGAYRTAYSAQVMAAGGQPAYGFEVVGGSLPPGLSMNAFGTVTGSPTAVGTYTFTVKATDSANPVQTDTEQISITIGKGATNLAVTPVVLQVTSNLGIKVNIALLEADLTGGFPAIPVAGQPVVFSAGGTPVCTASTDAQGHVKCQTNLVSTLVVILNGGVTATYAGNTTWLPSSGSAPLIGN